MYFYFCIAFFHAFFILLLCCFYAFEFQCKEMCYINQTAIQFGLLKTLKAKGLPVSVCPREPLGFTPCACPILPCCSLCSFFCLQVSTVFSVLSSVTRQIIEESIGRNPGGGEDGEEIKGFSSDSSVYSRRQMLIYNTNKQTSPLWLHFIFQISLTRWLFKIRSHGECQK